jgi:hypothetical protein
MAAGPGPDRVLQNVGFEVDDFEEAELLALEEVGGAGEGEH